MEQAQTRTAAECECGCGADAYGADDYGGEWICGCECECGCECGCGADAYGAYAYGAADAAEAAADAEVCGTSA